MPFGLVVQVGSVMDEKYKHQASAKSAQLIGSDSSFMVEGLLILVCIQTQNLWYN